MFLQTVEAPKRSHKKIIFIFSLGIRNGHSSPNNGLNDVKIRLSNFSSAIERQRKIAAAKKHVGEIKVSAGEGRFFRYMRPFIPFLELDLGLWAC